MPIIVIPVIVVVTIMQVVAAFVYFGLTLGILEAFQGANFGYAFGLRVGFAASVIGAVTGALLALELKWKEMKRKDGSPAWFTRLLALAAVAMLISIPVSNSGFEALGSLMHYGKLGLFAPVLFLAGSRFMVGLDN